MATIRYKRVRDARTGAKVSGAIGTPYDSTPYDIYWLLDSKGNDPYDFHYSLTENAPYVWKAFTFEDGLSSSKQGLLIT